MARITINDVSIDPSRRAGADGGRRHRGAGRLPVELHPRPDGGPLTEEQKAELAGLGVRSRSTYPDDTYLAGTCPTDLGPIRALPFVTWAGVYLKGFKIPPIAQPAAADPATAVVPDSAAARPVASRDGRRRAARGGRPEPVKAAIAAAARVDPTARRRAAARYGCGRTGPVGQAGRAGRGPPHRAGTRAAAVQQRGPAGSSTRDVVVNGTTYQGDGEIVAVADTGFDRGSTSNVAPGVHRPGDEALSRSAAPPDKSDDPHGHGTHVAGSVLGDGNSATMGGAIQGTAPGATLSCSRRSTPAAAWAASRPTCTTCSSRPTTTTAPGCTRTPGARPTPGLPYDASAREIDDFVWNHPDLVICFAAGNDGTDANANGVVDAGSIGSQSAAKNCITVGASESLRPNFKTQLRHLLAARDFPAAPISRTGRPTTPTAWSRSAAAARRRRVGSSRTSSRPARASCPRCRARPPCRRFGAVDRPAVLLRQRDDHGHAAGRRLRGGAARDAGQERHSPRRAPR